jgi:hypothetical protein
VVDVDAYAPDTAALGQMSREQMPCDREDPGKDVRTRSECASCAMKIEQRLLKEILGIAQVTRAAKQVPQERRRNDFVDDREGSVVPLHAFRVLQHRPVGVIAAAWVADCATTKRSRHLR